MAGGGENQLEMVEEVEEGVEQEVVVEWLWRWWRWWRARLASRALLHELDRRRLRPVVHVRVAGGLGVRVGQRLLELGQRASVLNFHAGPLRRAKQGSTKQRETSAGERQERFS